VLVKSGHVDKGKSIGMKSMAILLSNPKRFRWGGAIGRMLLKFLPFVVNNRFNPWYKQREMPRPPAQSFNQWYRENRKKNGE
jgi:L-lactate dehydrogenase complex protein LldF